MLANFTPSGHIACISLYVSISSRSLKQTPIAIVKLKKHTHFNDNTSQDVVNVAKKPYMHLLEVIWVYP